jgi:hypothetical protein
MSDFEVHERGTATELRLSRELIHEMDEVMRSYGRGIFPANVLTAYDKLVAHHTLMLVGDGL